MRKRIVIAGLALVSLLAAGSVAASDRWLHVAVDDENGRTTRVRVNVPFSIIERALPVLPDLRDYDIHAHADLRGRHVKHHDSCIHVNGEEFDLGDLRAVVAGAAAQAEGSWGEYATEDVTVRYSREGPDLRLRVHDQWDDDWTDVTVPMGLAEVIAAQDEKELDIRPIAQWLVDRGEGELVLVRDERTRVRVWVDENPEGR